MQQMKQTKQDKRGNVYWRSKVRRTSTKVRRNEINGIRRILVMKQRTRIERVLLFPTPCFIGRRLLPCSQGAEPGIAHAPAKIASAKNFAR